MFSAALYARVPLFFLPLAHETAGAARIRHSLLPQFEGERYANLGQVVPRERERASAVVLGSP